MKSQDFEPLSFSQRSELVEKLSGFLKILNDALAHLDACLTLRDWGIEFLLEAEKNEFFHMHYRLSVIECYKLLSYSVDENGVKKKNKNDKYSIYSLLAYFAGINGKHKSRIILCQLSELNAELEKWSPISDSVIKLRNEAYAHFGSKTRREALKFYDPILITNLTALLGKYFTIFNEEYDLKLGDFDDNLFSKSYKRIQLNLKDSLSIRR